jgi:hypothetical protein
MGAGNDFGRLLDGESNRILGTSFTLEVTGRKKKIKRRKKTVWNGKW